MDSNLEEYIDSVSKVVSSHMAHSVSTLRKFTLDDYKYGFIKLNEYMIKKDSEKLRKEIFDDSKMFNELSFQLFGSDDLNIIYLIISVEAMENRQRILMSIS